MAKLFFRYGAMSSGKSAHLLLTNFNYVEKGLKTLIFTSSKDDRYGINKIKSRVGLESEAVGVNDDMDLYEIVKNERDIKCVFLDESQFFSKKQIFQLTDIVDKLDIPVICYGLRSDYTMNVFEGSSYLLALADDISELKTICWCGKKATINARLNGGKITTSGDQILIGDTNYISLCRKHFKENKLKN